MTPSKNVFPLVITGTAIFTAAATIALVLLYGYFLQDWIFSAAISFGTTCYHFTMRLTVGWFVPKLASRLSPSCRWFQPRRFEPLLYQKLQVKNWKGLLPTYAPEQFNLRTNSLTQVIQNTCSAELVHEVIILFCFVPLLFSRFFGAFPVFLTTSLLAALYDSIFVLAQRYNRPRLVRILKKKVSP